MLGLGSCGVGTWRLLADVLQVWGGHLVGLDVVTVRWLRVFILLVPCSLF